MPDSISFDPAEVIDMQDIEAKSFAWAKKHECILPEFATDVEYSIIINGLRILEHVIMRQMKQNKANKAAYLFPLKAADKIDYLEESLKD